MSSVRLSTIIIRGFLVALLCSTAALASDFKVLVESPSGGRVSGVQVSLFRITDNAGVGVQTTAGDGTATFPHLADGQYRLVVLAPGFAEQSLTVTIPKTETLNIELKLATTPQTVVVSATATPATPEQTGTSVGVLTGEQLKTVNPVSAPDALLYIPGAIVSSTGRRGNLASLFVRGGESNYNKVLVDGVPVNDPGGIFDFGVVPMNNVDRLEVERGPESTVYGSDAMTSVVQLWTATGSTPMPEIQFGADGGNFSTANGYASLAGARGILDYNAFANQFNTQGQGVNDAYSNSLLGGNVGVRLSDRVAFRLRARHYNSWTGIQSNWWFNGNPELPPDPNQYAHQNNFLTSGDLTVSGPGAWQHQFSGFEYHHVALNVNPVDDLDRPFDSAFNSLAKYNLAGLAYQGIYSPRPWAQTTLGYNFEDENGYINNNSDFGITTTHGLRFNNYLFAQQTIVWRRLSVLVGVGYVNNSSFGGKVSPRASLTFLALRGNSVFSGTRLHFGYSEGIKEPSFEQTFGITGTFPTLPNPNLQPEQNRAIEAGVLQSLFNNRVSLSAVYFHNQFRDQIEYVYNSDTNTSQYVNFNRAMAQGAEVVLSSRVANHLSATAAYTYTSTQIQQAPPCDPNAGCDPRIYGTGAPLLRRPKQAGMLLLTYSRQRWGGFLGVTAVGWRPDSDFLFGYIPPIYYAAGYARLDLGGWYAINHHVTTYANVDNALNNHYNEVLGYPALRANFRAGMRFSFGGE
ncbi:MAG: TonB-dependent receptor [Candidatus Korobacteraceae bacterium]|jgi:outer membrane cobalamin receptor